MVKQALMKNIPNQVGTDLVTTNNVKYSKKHKRPFPRDRAFPGNNSPYNNVPKSTLEILDLSYLLATEK